MGGGLGLSVQCARLGVDPVNGTAAAFLFFSAKKPTESFGAFGAFGGLTCVSSSWGSGVGVYCCTALLIG